MATEFLIKDDLSDYTEQEFINILERIIGNEGSEEEESKLVLPFSAHSWHSASCYENPSISAVTAGTDG